MRSIVLIWCVFQVALNVFPTPCARSLAGACLGRAFDSGHALAHRGGRGGRGTRVVLELVGKKMDGGRLISFFLKKSNVPLDTPVSLVISTKNIR